MFSSHPADPRGEIAARRSRSGGRSRSAVLLAAVEVAGPTSPRESSAGLARDGIPSRSVGPGRRRRRAAAGVAACGLALAALGGAFLAGPGRSAELGPIQLSPRFPGGPYISLACGMSHRNNDDPIVFAGQPG